MRILLTLLITVILSACVNSDLFTEPKNEEMAQAITKAKENKNWGYKSVCAKVGVDFANHVADENDYDYLSGFVNNEYHEKHVVVRHKATNVCADTTGVLDHNAVVLFPCQELDYTMTDIEVLTKQDLIDNIAYYAD